VLPPGKSLSVYTLFISPTTGHYIIYKHVTVYKAGEFGEIWTCDSRDMYADKERVRKHTYRQTAIVQGESKKTP